MTNLENNLQMQRQVEERKLHGMAKVDHFLEIWGGSQGLSATQKESRNHNTQMAAVGYILDTQEIVKVSWSNYEHDGGVAFKLPERSHVPPALSAKDLPGGSTQVVNVHGIETIEWHPAESDEERTPESNSHPDNWPHWNGDLDNPNYSEDNWETDNESDMDVDSGVEDPESPALRDVSATRHIPGMIRPTRRSNWQVGKVLMTGNKMETKRNIGNEKKQDRMCRCGFTRFFMTFDGEFHLDLYYGRILSSCMWILVNKQKNSGWNELFGKMYKF